MQLTKVKRASSRHRRHDKRSDLLRPDDFDDVQYSMEVVRLADSSRNAAVEAANDRTELYESVFVMVVGVAFLGGAVVMGVVAMETSSSKVRETLWYLLPMLLLPVAWFTLLHLWERLLLPPSPSSSTPIPTAVGTKSSSTRRASKVAIF